MRIIEMGVSLKKKRQLKFNNLKKAKDIGIS
jgi:hypothetical protein